MGRSADRPYRLDDPESLDAIRAIGLLDADSDGTFDRLAALAAQEMLKAHGQEPGVEMVPFRWMVCAPEKDAYLPADEVPEGMETRWRRRTVWSSFRSRRRTDSGSVTGYSEPALEDALVQRRIERPPQEAEIAVAALRPHHPGVAAVLVPGEEEGVESEVLCNSEIPGAGMRG